MEILSGDHGLQPSHRPAGSLSVSMGDQVWDAAIVRTGLAAVIYDGNYVCLLAGGDVVPRTFLEKPFAVQALTSLHLAKVPDGQGLNNEASLHALARHAARCVGMRALERTVDFFVELADKANPQWRDYAVVDLPITQGVIADLLGMSVVHLNRTLSKLRSNNLIELDGAWLRIRGKNSFSVRQRAKELQRLPG